MHHVDTKMRRMLRARDCWPGISRRFRLLHKRSFCTTNRNTPTASSSSNDNSSSNGDKADGALTNYNDAYRQLDKLDFMTAAKILFTTPPKKKKFGLDFHLVQLFFALMPSLAVYLVAQYARYEMRRMEAELEEKKKVEEEAKAKEIELNASNEKESSSDPELLQVKERLHKLEEAVNEIVVESKKHVDGTFTKNQNDSSQKRNHTETDDSNTQNRSDASNSTAKDNNNRHAAENVKSSLSRGNAGGLEAPVIEASQQDLKGTQNGGPAKK